MNIPSTPEHDQAAVIRHPVAYFLWGVVGVALAYGVFMTAIKASALFTS